MAEPVEAFAERLRELKERSGHSYGALAKRLHMSTSTVHRYCNGAAVPTEFAPVERFARLCGARREELVELHRAWIVADDARRRKAGPARKETAGPAEAPPPEATDPAKRPVPEGPPEDTAERDGQLASPGTDAPESIDTAVPEPAPHVAARPAGRRRLRHTLLAAALAAVVVPAAVVAGCSAGSQRADRDGAAPAGPTASATWRPPRADVPPGTSTPPSPRNTPDRSTPPGTDGRPLPPDVTGSPAPGPEGSVPSSPPDREKKGREKKEGKNTPAHRPDAPAPLTVSVRPYALTERCDTLYLTGRQPGAVVAPPEGKDAGDWTAAMQAVPGGRMRLQVTVQGTERKAVVLHAMRVRVAGERRPPLDWSAYAMGDGCGGGLTPAHFDVDLDRDRPAARPVSGRQGDLVIPATDFPYKASSTDPQVLDVLAHTDGHDVSWYLELDWSSGDRHGTLRIKDRGQPFRTSAVKERPQYAYRFDTRTWELLPDYARR
ncbi:helix-turn-helix transcriptional regulator [Streptomyces sp. AV19]|uniref:transcriptional regulator n=1 Tax=Streptomyces sp. AV19 TaxID=2793068 RepID=UPI001F229CF2|nr:helix-turn-helix transcriptional regulator [Streptomyces sp. AV19]MDG4530825.1 helix-turn-helix domain-containing protein [Streptomyces sp. AV19]